jgi:hypothetical protein
MENKKGVRGGGLQERWDAWAGYWQMTYSGINEFKKCYQFTTVLAWGFRGFPNLNMWSSYVEFSLTVSKSVHPSPFWGCNCYSKLRLKPKICTAWFPYYKVIVIVYISHNLCTFSTRIP